MKCKKFPLTCCVSVRSSQACGSKNASSDVWSGIIVGKCNEYYVLTQFSPFTKFMSCEMATGFQNKASHAFINPDEVMANCTVSNGYFTHQVMPVFAWKSMKFCESVKKLLSSMNLVGEKNDTYEKKCCDAHYSLDFLAWFLIFHVQETETLHMPASITLHHALEVHQGMTVWCNSYPFGHTASVIFRGCISRGIVCNHINDVILLTDACCLPGSEGGVLCTADGLMVGMVVTPLVLKSGELTGLSIACSASELKASLLKSEVMPNGTYTLFKSCNLDLLTENCPSQNPYAGENVVVLRHMKGWGSGVVVAINVRSKCSDVYVATCSHVVTATKRSSLFVKMSNDYTHGQFIKAKILYISKKEWFDFALIKIVVNRKTATNILLHLQGCLQQIKDDIHVAKYVESYEKGSNVLAVGHCLFENLDIPPTATCGVLSNVAFAEGESQVNAVLLYSSCIVHDGCSGGALILDAYKPSLLGLIVNNVKETQSGSQQILYPQISFGLPAALFMPSIVDYLCNSHMGAFDALDNIACTKQYADLWKMDAASEENLKCKL